MIFDLTRYHLVLYLNTIPNGIEIHSLLRTVMNQALQSSFKALADPTRRSILMHLSTQDMTVQELTNHFDMTRAAVKKHLNILENGKLIKAQQQGRNRINSIDIAGLESVTEWLNYFDQFWDSRLDKLTDVINAHGENNNV